jgi:hypothetical protein
MIDREGSGALDHGLGRRDFCLPHACGRLHVHDHRVVEIDQMVVAAAAS